MAKREVKTQSDRIGAGTALACLTLFIVFGLWRIALTYDGAVYAEEWNGLVYEFVLMVFSMPIFAAVVAGLGAILVHKGTGARSHSVLGMLALALAYAFILYVYGPAAGELSGPGSSPYISVPAFAVAGAAGGFIGHVGWFPPGYDAAESRR